MGWEEECKKTLDSVEKQVQELHQIIAGPKGHPDESMMGDIKNIEGHLRKQNDRIESAEKSISRIKGIGIGLAAITVVVGATIGIVQLCT